MTELDAPRRGFATVVINSTSLVLVGGFNVSSVGWYAGVTSDFLMYHLDTDQWVRLPNYPYKQTDFACCNFDDGMIQGIFCIGGVGPDPLARSNYAVIYNWNTEEWSRESRYDISIDGSMRGSIIQFKNWLFYAPHATNAYPNNKKVFKLNLNDTTMIWEDLGLIGPTHSTYPLFYLVDVLTIR